MLEKLYRILEEYFGESFPEAYYWFGCAFLEKDKDENAYKAFQIAVSLSKGQNPKILYSQAISQLKLKRYKESIESLQQYKKLLPESGQNIEDVIKKIGILTSGQKYALLVGINIYYSTEIPPIKGAVNDVHALKKVLLEKFNFKTENINVLLNKEATYDMIMKSFKQLLKDSEGGSAFFYFAGAGSYYLEEGDKSTDKRHDSLSIVSVDGRDEGIYDIDLKELSYLSSNKNLVTVIDAGWTPSGDRNAPSDKRKMPQTRDRPRNISKEYELNLKIGELTIYSQSITLSSSSLYNESEFHSFENYDNQVYHGKLTYAIIKAFIENDTNNLTYSNLYDSISTVSPKIVSDKKDTIIFSNSKLVDELARTLKVIEKFQVLNKVIILLRRMIEQRNDIYPEGYLNLGISYAEKDDYDKGIEFIDRAVVQKNNFYPEASYYLGKFLFEKGKEFARAVSILREVIKYEPNNNPAYYYLGQSIRSLIETETLLEAERSLRIYLENGAEIGYEENIQEFLNSIEEKKRSIKVSSEAHHETHHETQTR